jgi:hypothetical protein
MEQHVMPAGSGYLAGPLGLHLTDHVCQVETALSVLAGQVAHHFDRIPLGSSGGLTSLGHVLASGLPHPMHQLPRARPRRGRQRVSYVAQSVEPEALRQSGPRPRIRANALIDGSCFAAPFGALKIKSSGSLGGNSRCSGAASAKARPLVRWSRPRPKAATARRCGHVSQVETQDFSTSHGQVRLGRTPPRGRSKFHGGSPGADCTASRRNSSPRVIGKWLGWPESPPKLMVTQPSSWRSAVTVLTE